MNSNFIEEYPDSISSEDCLRLIHQFEKSAELYLNTIDDKGGTDFQYQDFTCKAESGKMVIWPPYWTHFHRSQVSPSSIKYIMTGWFSYV